MSLALASPTLGMGLNVGLGGVAIGMGVPGGELAWAAGAGVAGMWPAPWQTLAHAVAAAGVATPVPAWHRPPPQSNQPMTCS